MRSPWLWVPTLFAAGEIPVTLLCFVSLLMFLQTGASPALATLCSGCLALPWALLALCGGRPVNLRRCRLQTVGAELSVVVALMLLALCFTWRGFNTLWLFALLLLLSLLSAWHHLASRGYYVSTLRAPERQPWRGVAVFFSQVATIFTYGLVLMLVGALQVMYRGIRLPWGLGCYIAAGVFLLFTLYHLLALPKEGAAPQVNMRRSKRWRLALVFLFLVLLPQSLMFFSRVLFLFTPSSQGGLGCTIQEIAFAQGAVGVIGFALGMALAGRLYRASTFWAMAFALGISPCVYLTMVLLPPQSLMALSAGTFTAQFLFGFGLPSCRAFLRQLNGGRRLDLTHICASMCLPCALSGWMVTALGFKAFFAVNSSLALVSWLTLALCSPRRKCHEE